MFDATNTHDTAQTLVGGIAPAIVATGKAPTIKTVPFGDRAQLARQLQSMGKASELKVETLVAALVPMVSNFAAGHGTFKPLIAGKGHNAACPLQTEVAGFKATSKAGKARAMAFALAARASNQEEHDALCDAVALAIATALAPAPRTEAPAPRVDWKSRAETLEVEAEALRAELAAARAALEAAGLSAPVRTVAEPALL